MKDRVEVQCDRDPNYIQAADGHLIIIQAREKDRGNYTCVAENVANRRLSPPARLSVVGMLLSISKLIYILYKCIVCISDITIYFIQSPLTLNHLFVLSLSILKIKQLLNAYF